MECLRYKPVNKGCLLGFADLLVPIVKNVKIYGCAVFQKEGKRWVSLPSNKMIDPETGIQNNYAFMRFDESKGMYEFSHDAMRCIIPHIDPRLLIKLDAESCQDPA